jgi:hypothetical protein
MVGALAMLFAVPAYADGAGTVTFFKSPGADARWVHFSPPPPGDPDTWSIKLTLPTASDYAGADLNGVAGPPPSTPPSFDFYSTVTGASGGSPRLVMVFSDNTSTSPSDMSLRPLSWTSGTWTHEDGASTDWDNRGGTCGFLYEQSYSVEMACHAGKTVTDVFVVTDSAWLAGPYTHYIDNIAYGSAFITSPEESGCREGDGGGDFQDQNGHHGNVQMDNDSCEESGHGGNGDSGQGDRVDSSDRGDGKDFHSSSIQSSNYDASANTMTITGLGTSNGIPVAFTLVALETGNGGPGWVSMVFSDGYAIAGDLLDGSITLN